MDEKWTVGDSLIHLAERFMEIAAGQDKEIAALRAELVTTKECRDHWKVSYENVRADLKRAEGERSEAQDTIKNNMAAYESVLKLATGFQRDLTARREELARYERAMGLAREALQRISLMQDYITYHSGYDNDGNVKTNKVAVRTAAAGIAQEAIRLLDEATESGKGE